MKPTSKIEELSAELIATKIALRQTNRIAAVAHYAVDAAHEAADSLEILTNLHYLIRTSSGEPQKVLEYLEAAETQSLRLLEINGRILGAHRHAMADSEAASGQFVM